MTFDDDLLKTFKERYNVHPLIFHRSAEHAKDELDLFEILESIPDFPIIWDNQKRRWQHTDLT